MIAVDTNLLVRYAVKDDPVQTVTAIDFLRNNPCHVLKTVLLELAWVLSSTAGYNLSREVVAERLRHILGLPTVEMEDAVSVAQAITWFEQGMDFADALHLASSSRLHGFATMDRRLKERAAKIGCNQSVVLLG
jgi:predicted nucleic-acid-binding protein